MLLLLPGVDASHVYVGAWALFASTVLLTPQRALTAPVDSYAEIKGFSGVTNSGRVWRKVREKSDARSVECLSPFPVGVISTLHSARREEDSYALEKKGRRIFRVELFVSSYPPSSSLIKVYPKYTYSVSPVKHQVTSLVSYKMSSLSDFLSV